MRFATGASTALLSALVLSGCTGFENAALRPGQENSERRLQAARSPEEPFILVALSGGGTRAAALGWSVLEVLKRANYTTPDGQSRRLIDDVAVLSSVSGGSVTAAYLGLRGPDGIDDMPDKFFRQHNIRWLVLRALNPYTWILLKSQGKSRIALEEELFDHRLFSGARLGQLNAAGAPLLILNSTDMATGEVFSFTPERFEDICSDFDGERVSVAVAASAAFPIAMSPVALRNYSASACPDRPIPQWVAAHMASPFGRYTNLSEFKSVRYTYDLRRGGNGNAPGVSRQLDYLYLLDGGLADNQGIHGLFQALSQDAPRIISGLQPNAEPERLLQALNLGHLKKLVVIVVNARADPRELVTTRAHRPGIVGMFQSVTSVPIDSVTASVNSAMEDLLEQLKQAGGGGAGDPAFTGLRVYGVQVDFDQFDASDPAQRQLQDEAKKIPTSWTISETEFDVLQKSASALLDRNPCFQRLLIDVGGRPKADPAYALKGCPQLCDP